jgi:hypothetical protein
MSYIRGMRFLIPFLFVILYVAAPLQTSAKVVFANKNATSIVHNKPSKESLHYSVSNLGEPLFLSQSQRRNVAQCNDQSFNENFSYDQQMRTEMIFVKNHFLVAPLLYYKAIRLVLIFPEHFFF